MGTIELFPRSRDCPRPHPWEQEGRGETLYLLPQATHTCEVAKAREGRCPPRLRPRTLNIPHSGPAPGAGLLIGGGGTCGIPPSKPHGFMSQFN